jgi:serine/threonine protein kinase
LVETLARAVQHAHAKGIVHRDLKPANILLADGGGEPMDACDPTAGSGPLRAGGVLKITDFGVAKQLETAATVTAEGVAVGTPQYMAPEQAAGRSRAVGPAADVYSLGAILYELLTGWPPFVGESTYETLRQVIEQEPVPPRRLQPRIPRDLETVCLKCLAKEPARRYPTAAALAGDLRRFLTGKPVKARRVGPIGRLWRWDRRNPVEAGLIAMIGLVLAAGFAGVAWQ